VVVSRESTGAGGEASGASAPVHAATVSKVETAMATTEIRFIAASFGDV